MCKRVHNQIHCASCAAAKPNTNTVETKGESKNTDVLGTQTPVISGGHYQLDHTRPKANMQMCVITPLCACQNCTNAH